MGNISRIEVKKHEANSQNFVSKNRKPCCSKTRSSSVERVLFLQRTIGNQAVERLVKSGALQAKLRIGAPGDVYEQEADRVADAVMRMPQPQIVSSGTPSIQRACPKCEEEELKRQPIKEEDEEKKLQTKSNSGNSPEITPDFESRIQAIRDGGRSLPETVRAFFEPRFEHNFRSVRIHTGGMAAEAARAVNARAFTLGNNVVFGAGQYSPDTMGGKRLLAHELTHVIQQRASNLLSAGRDILQTTPETCTYGEIGSWAVTSMRDFTAPAGLGNAKASIGSACSPANCNCVDGSSATAPSDQAAWRNIVAASGTDLSGGGNFMCVGSENCWFVDRCYSCVNGRRTLTNRQTPLASSGTCAVTGKGTLYFYSDPLQGWCNANDRRTACRRSHR